MYISYKNILAKAWRILWKHKTLWLFGAFASFVSLEGVYEIILSQVWRFQNLGLLYSDVLNLYPSQTGAIKSNALIFSQLPNNYVAFGLIILFILIAALFVWLAYVSQIFIIKSAELAYKNKKVEKKKIFSESMEKFWPVLGINILAKLLLYCFFIALSLPLYYSLIEGRQNIIIAANLFFFISFTVFAVVVSFLTAYATNFIALKNSSAIGSIENAARLFSKNIGISLEIAFILFLLKITSLVIIFSLFFLCLTPLLMFLMISSTGGSIIGLIVFAILIVLVFTLISMLINSIFTVFYLNSWTITFIKLTEESVFGKIFDFIRNLPIIFKKNADKFNVQIDKAQLEKNAIILGKRLEKTYDKYEPVAKKQGRAAVKEIAKIYSEYQPIVKKEIGKYLETSKPKKIKTARKIKKNAKK